jgi:hypothetical protein
LERYDVDQNRSADSTDVAVVRGINVTWFNLSQFNKFPIPGQVRIPATNGQWYQFNVQIGGNGPYTFAANNQVLLLSSPYIGPTNVPFANNNANPNANDVVAVLAANASCDIQLGSEVLPFHAPIPLPSGVVIDLRYSSSNIQFLAGSSLAAGSTPPNIDIQFSPRGSVPGATGGLGAFYFCLRDLDDAMQTSTFPATLGGPRDPSDAACTGDCLVLGLNPATGLVQTYPANLTDAYNNATGVAGADGYADNLFSFAQQGKAAGR